MRMLGDFLKKFLEPVAINKDTGVKMVLAPQEHIKRERKMQMDNYNTSC